jgi:hypothetical protein
MTNTLFQEEAEDCRRKALAYVGQPETPFLLRIASEFDRLACESQEEVIKGSIGEHS